MVYFKRLYCENGNRNRKKKSKFELSCQFLLLGKNEGGVVKGDLFIYTMSYLGTPRK